MQKLICVLLAYQNVLNFENRTIFKADMAKNVSEGEIQAVYFSPLHDLRTSVS